jgi:HAD superfamily hydrolase (TIGR01509 family)
MTPSWILFDWGDTLMSEDGPADYAMADWPEVRAIAGAEEVVPALAARHLLAIATNASVSDRQAIERALARVGLAQHLSEIFCFRDLGLKKTDPRFWDVVEARLGVPRARLLMIGDDLENDVLAPQRCGVAAIWFNWKRAPTPPRLTVTMIDRLEELLALLT